MMVEIKKNYSPENQYDEFEVLYDNYLCYLWIIDYFLFAVTATGTRGLPTTLKVNVNDIGN
jgi:hypothetical protein